MKGRGSWRWGMTILLGTVVLLTADPLHLEIRSSGIPVWIEPHRRTIMLAPRPAPTSALVASHAISTRTSVSGDPHSGPVDFEETVVTYQRDLERAHRAGDLFRVGAALNNLGSAYLKIG